MSDLEYGKKIITESYHEGKLASVKQEREVSVFSNRETLLKDTIEALSVITKSQTHKLDICIKVDTKGQFRLTKRWVEE